MKKVIMIFSTNENMGAINYLHNQLENVFESEIEIEDVFLDALNRNEKLEADAYLIVSEDILELLKNNISDFSRILIVRRAINKNSLSDVEKISDDANARAKLRSYYQESATISSKVMPMPFSILG